MPGDEFPPLCLELHPPPEPEQVFLRLAARSHCLFLDSALKHPKLGRYSFVAADPFAWLRVEAADRDALARLQRQLLQCNAETLPELPPFQAGAAGVFGYELGRQFERVPAARFDEFGFPALAVGLYDVVIAFDHLQRRAWLISQGWPETDPALRRRRAAARLAEFRQLLAAAPAASSFQAPQQPIESVDLAPQFEVPGPPGLTSNFSRKGYLEAVRRAVDYVYAGDVFQVNLAQRLLFPAKAASRADGVDLYLRLRRRNAATFAGYIDLGDFQVLSASPERFVRVNGGQVEARPIKGTRRRRHQPEADLYAASDLLASEKDRAENVMIVDLLRNDLSRVCRPESVRVTQLCQTETYEFVQHLVSVVRGDLRSGQASLDLLRAAFPGGSITGAPKLRAMEIIAELEPTARGAYCGSLGYLGGDGAMDLSILIRTITAGRGWWQLPVGGGIVAQSDPQREYEETWHKAEGLLRALQ